MTGAPWRLLLPVLMAVGLIAGPSNRTEAPTRVDVQAARACQIYSDFYDGPQYPFNPAMFSRQPPAQRALLTYDYERMLATTHTPTAQDVRDAAAPLQSSKWAALRADLVTAADAGQTGRTPQDGPLLTAIDHGCNELSVAAKLAGGWKPDS
jgi:hypothetical protein